MSLRRKSCNGCFKGRRKCNLAYPTCGTCQKANKPCHYTYPPLPARAQPAINAANNEANPTLTNDAFSKLLDVFDTSNLDLDYLSTGHIADFFIQEPPFPCESGSTTTSSLYLPSTPPDLSNIARLCGSLGEFQPIEGSTQSWQWVIDKLKSYPGEFARRGATVFIHEQLYKHNMPRSMRAAFGISASSCCLAETKRETLFRVVDEEVTELINFSERVSLVEDLARLQALVLYQMTRFFHGGVQQRVTAEQQQSVLFTRALKLLTRSKKEIAYPANREEWILTECIRRTAIMVYFIYGVNSVCQEGICIGLPTLTKLPLSTEFTYWDSSDVGLEGMAEAVPYETFIALWLVSTPKKLDPFEKFLLVPCQGLDNVERYDTGALAY